MVQKKETNQYKAWTYDSEKNCESIDHLISGGLSNNVTSREVKSKTGETVEIVTNDYAEETRRNKRFSQ